ncbi:hypothetical protein E1J02_04830 [Phocaeicola dorei]|uniref:hypothetical protein n=1 Tax=Bacteroides ovatus TaxID=28116 RepID=UPI0002D709EF|nr:hypothetical protein [Bacteroides ovatus]TDA83870.1 hypothetical protein E1J05_00430 [Phocaeicola dorei]TDA91365.1 hypothetical protein E1J02_04830 [Phocaeicola dorei]
MTAPRFCLKIPLPLDKLEPNKGKKGNVLVEETDWKRFYDRLNEKPASTDINQVKSNVLSFVRNPQEPRICGLTIIGFNGQIRSSDYAPLGYKEKNGPVPIHREQGRFLLSADL